MKNMIVSKADVCELLGISTSTLDRMRKKKQFPEGTVLSGRKVCWLRSVVEEYIRKMFTSRGAPISA